MIMWVVVNALTRQWDDVLVPLLLPCCVVLRRALCQFADWLQRLRQQLLMMPMIQP